MKKIIYFILISLLLLLCSCFKQSRYTFQNGVYIYTELLDETFNDYEVQDFSITLNQIDEEQYENANKINVIKNKNNGECYEMVIDLSIKEIDDIDILSEEISGLTDRPNAYYFNITFFNTEFEQTIETELYFFEKNLNEDEIINGIELSKHTDEGYELIAYFKLS